MLYVSMQSQIAQNANSISISEYRGSAPRPQRKTLEEAEMLPLRFFLLGRNLSIPKMPLMLKTLENRGFCLCPPLQRCPQRQPDFEVEVGRGRTFGVHLCGQRQGPLRRGKWKIVLPLRGNWFCTGTPTPPWTAFTAAFSFFTNP